MPNFPCSHANFPPVLSGGQKDYNIACMIQSVKMREIWKETKMVNRRYITGNTPLDEVTSNIVFQNAVFPLLNDDEEIKEVHTLFEELAQRFEDVSALRTAIQKDPRALNLDDNTTKFLLALFANKGSAAQY